MHLKFQQIQLDRFGDYPFHFCTHKRTRNLYIDSWGIRFRDWNNRLRDNSLHY